MMPAASSSPHWWMWVLFGLFLAFLVGGIALGVWWLSRPADREGRARDILAERLARGDISPQEYSERLQLLGEVGHRRGHWAGPLALAFAVIGLVGALTTAAIGVGPTNGMMSDGMAMMGGGQPGRSGPEASPGARKVQVIAREFYFQPSELRVRVGETVNLEFKDEGMMFHTFTVRELGIDLRANPGQSISGALRADRPGTFTFICAVLGHAQLGMRGSIVVTP